MGQVNLQASEVTFDLGGQEELALALAGALEISDLTLAKDGEEPLAVELETGHIDLKSLRVDSIGPGGATVETALAAKLAALQVSQGSAKAAQKLTIDSTDIGVDSLNVKTSEPLSLSLSGSTTFSGTKGALPLAGGKTLQANVGQVNLQAVEIILEGEAFRSAVDIAATGITIRTDEELPQIIDLKGLTVEGLKVDPAQQIEIAAITVDQLNAEINEGILAPGGKGAADSKKDDGADEGAPPPLRLGRVSISKGSTIKVSDNSIEPPMKLEITIENAEVGPIDTGALDTQTEIDLGTAINKEADIKVLGWASPLLPTPDFDLTAEVSKLPLPPFSPYVGSAVGMNIDSGILNVVAKANVDAGALKGQIDVLVDELYLEPVSAESEEGFESSYGVSANFAAGILKNDKGQIDLSFPVSGSVEEPEIDYSEVISKAIGGAMAALFPLNWFGDDESSFEILPATFDVGTADLTDAGEEAGDKVGALLADELQLSIRICGKATASDLIVLRGGEPPEEVTEAEAVEQEGIASEEAAEEDGVAAEPPQRVEKPSEQEVDQLLKLAIQRSEVVRQYLTSNFNINTSRMSECRTSYSIEDSKPPRAEFRF